MPGLKYHRGERVTRNRITYTPDSYGGMGTALFAQYTMLSLTEQVRASAAGELNDQHRKMLSRLRDTSIDSPIDRETLQYLGRRVITAAHVAARPELARAPIMCACNAERIAMQTAKAQRFSKEIGAPLLMYKVTLKLEQEVTLSPDDIQLMFDQDDALWRPFVAGRGAFLTATVSRERGLCNGYPVQTHSLTFKGSPEAQQHIRDMIDAAGPGDIVHLPTTPESVNVIIPDATPEGWGEGASLLGGQVIIPVRRATTVAHKREVLLRGRYVNIEFTTIGVELDFCVSLYKAQSRTLPLAIMDANERPGTVVQFESLVVGGSRVEDAKDFFLMPVLPGQKLFHLLDLRVSSQLRTYMGGFVEGRGKFDSARAQVARDAYEGTFTVKKRAANRVGTKRTQLDRCIRANISGSKARGESVSATLVRAASAAPAPRPRGQAAAQFVPNGLCLLPNFGASCFINVILWVSHCMSVH